MFRKITLASAAIGLTFVLIATFWFQSVNSIQSATVPTLTPTPSRFGPPQPAPPLETINQGLAPTPVTTIDLSPGVNEADKVSIIVARPDGTRAKYFIEPSQAETFAATLPPDSIVVSSAPAASMKKQPPAPVDVTPGIRERPARIGPTVAPSSPLATPAQRLATPVRTP